VLRDEPLAQDTLRALKKLGVKLSIDDPAVALSSLFFFATLPFDEIRLDVAAGRVSPKSGSVLKALVELARELRLFVVAVGVADDEEAARLKELGCDLLQSDYRGPALPPKEFIPRYGYTE
jgi:EAL domain-containing protein (putative c-di-GMP-specific phosphodiesterase class I)